MTRQSVAPSIISSSKDSGIVFNLLRRIYRASPFRPHCDTVAGRHVMLCRMFAQQEHCYMISTGR